MLRRCCLFLSALVSVALFSCKDDSGNGGNDIDSDISIVFSRDSIFFSKSGGELTVDITTNASPVKAESNADWLTISTLSIGEPSVLTLSATANGYSKRETTVTVTCGGATKNLVVVQWPEDLLDPYDGTETNLVLQKYHMDWEGAKFFVQYITNGTPTVEMPWWIREVSSEKFEKLEGDSVCAQYEVLKNYGDERLDSVIFKLGAERFSCKIEQGKTEFSFSGVNKTASEISDAFRYGWTFPGVHQTEAIETLQSELMDTIAAAGINVVRIPFHAGRDYVMEQTIANLKSTIEAVTSRKMDEEPVFAIVSLCNDTSVFYSDFENVWYLVADALAEYDYHVIFEAYDHLNYNETGYDISVYNKLNQAFVDAVRHTGANNFKRCLIIPGGEYESGIYAPMPEDDATNDDRLMASFNFFQPTEYTQPGATKKYWGADYQSETTDWSSYSESNIATVLSYMHSKQPRVPVVLNACGTISHTGVSNDLCAASEGAYIRHIAKTAKDESFTVILYDDGVCAANSFGVFSLTDKDLRTRRNLYVQNFVEGSGYEYAFAAK